MGMFNDDHYGKLLPERVVAFLADYTTQKDTARVCDEMDGNYHTITKVVNGGIPMSKKSAPFIERLMEVCVENCGNVMEKAQRDLEEFKNTAEV